MCLKLIPKRFGYVNPVYRGAGQSGFAGRGLSYR